MVFASHSIDEWEASPLCHFRLGKNQVAPVPGKEIDDL